MKITLKLFLICNILLLTSFQSQGQNKDYVITTAGEKIPCNISLSALFGAKEYKGPQVRGIQPINTEFVKEYYVAKQRTLYRKVLLKPGKESSAEFLAVKESGKINLYEQVTTISVPYVINPGPNGILQTGSSSTVTWYISKGSDTLTTIKDSDFSFFLKTKKSRKNAFGEMIRDNREVYEQYITDDKFSFKEIRDLIHRYNTGRSFESDMAQDYVIKKNKDTVFCQIEKGTFNTPPGYKPVNQDKFIKIDTSIVEYFLANDSLTFQLKTLPGDKHPKHVKCLVRGEVNLYAYSFNNAAADKEASLYASKQQGELILLKDEYHKPGKTEKNAFTLILSDNKGLTDKFAKLPYNYATILDGVQTYDNEYLTNGKTVK